MIQEEYYMQADRQLNYDHLTGELYWNCGRNKGKLATHVFKEGRSSRQYKRCNITLNGKRKKVLAHRIIWYKIYKRLPESIDHINRDSLDNRLLNLREATISQNSFNRVAIEDAIKARKEAEEKYFKEFICAPIY